MKNMENYKKWIKKKINLLEKANSEKKQKIVNSKNYEALLKVYRKMSKKM